jgi:hypothetical protein
MAYVYWIKRKEHTDVFSEGYVGVTTVELEKRFLQHSRVPKTSVGKAIRAIGIENLEIVPLVIAEADYCYEVEAKLRPREMIGWNQAVGGSAPPNKRGIKF